MEWAQNRFFKAIETRTFPKSGFEIEEGKIYKLSELMGNMGNLSVIKYFQETTINPPQGRAQWPRKNGPYRTALIIRYRYYKGKEYKWKERVSY